jgi:hypothetical protein
LFATVGTYDEDGGDFRLLLVVKGSLIVLLFVAMDEVLPENLDPVMEGAF